MILINGCPYAPFTTAWAMGSKYMGVQCIDCWCLQGGYGARGFMTSPSSPHSLPCLYHAHPFSTWLRLLLLYWAYCFTKPSTTFNTTDSHNFSFVPNHAFNVCIFWHCTSAVRRLNKWRWGWRHRLTQDFLRILED